MDEHDFLDSFFNLLIDVLTFLYFFWFICVVIIGVFRAPSPPKILTQIFEFLHLNPDLANDPLVMAVIIGILMTLLRSLMRIFQRWRRTRQLEAEREKWEPLRPEVAKPPSKLFLRELALMVESREAGRRIRRLGRWVNPNKVLAVRPVAIFEVNDKNLIGRIVPLTFELVDPNGRVRFECNLKVTLASGENRVLPLRSEFPILDKRLPRGRWQIRLHLGDHPWGQIGFVLIEKADIMAKDIVGSDAELKLGAEEQVEQLGDMSIDELLKD